MISDIFGIIFQAVVLNHILIEHLSILLLLGQHIMDDE